MAQSSEIVLRDVHLPVAPAWWPPAPGWWIVAAVVLVLLVVGMAWRWQRKRRLRAWQALFAQSANAGSASLEVAAISELLRRAARRVDPNADTLQDEEWLAFLDGQRGNEFTAGPGRLLLDGGYRKQVDAQHLIALRQLAQQRFIELMAGQR